MSFKVDLRWGPDAKLYPYMCGWCGETFRDARTMVEHVTAERTEEGK